MSVAAKGKRKTRAGSKALGEISTEVNSHAEVCVAKSEPHILHGAKCEGAPSPADPPPVTPTGDNEINLLKRKITELLDQIGEGLQADDATNFEKLTIARKYGALLWDLKALAPHGEFMNMLKERFPKVNYAKCNRWMVIAKSVRKK